MVVAEGDAGHEGAGAGRPARGRRAGRGPVDVGRFGGPPVTVRFGARGLLGDVGRFGARGPGQALAQAPDAGERARRVGQHSHGGARAQPGGLGRTRLGGPQRPVHADRRPQGEVQPPGVAQDHRPLTGGGAVDAADPQLDQHRGAMRRHDRARGGGHGGDEGRPAGGGGRDGQGVALAHVEEGGRDPQHARAGERDRQDAGGDGPAGAAGHLGAGPRVVAVARGPMAQRGHQRDPGRRQGDGPGAQAGPHTGRAPPPGRGPGRQGDGREAQVEGLGGGRRVNALRAAVGSGRVDGRRPGHGPAGAAGPADAIG